jgi:hypothetical protein
MEEVGREARNECGSVGFYPRIRVSWLLFELFFGGLRGGGELGDYLAPLLQNTIA